MYEDCTCPTGRFDEMGSPELLPHGTDPECRHCHPSDLDQMIRALKFCAELLRSELGPGGVMSETMDLEKGIWETAAHYLDTAVQYPIIPLHMWRRPADAERVDS